MTSQWPRWRLKSPASNSTVYSDADQRKHQSSASLAFMWGIHRDRWIPRTKGQLRGKCFHLMTSSCLLTLEVLRDFSRSRWPFGMMSWCQQIKHEIFNSQRSLKKQKTKQQQKQKQTKQIQKKKNFKLVFSAVLSTSAGRSSRSTHRGRNKMAATFQTTFWNGFSWI